MCMNRDMQRLWYGLVCYRYPAITYIMKTVPCEYCVCLISRAFVWYKRNYVKNWNYKKKTNNKGVKQKQKKAHATLDRIIVYTYRTVPYLPDSIHIYTTCT